MFMVRVILLVHAVAGVPTILAINIILFTSISSNLLYLYHHVFPSIPLCLTLSNCLSVSLPPSLSLSTSLRLLWSLFPFNSLPPLSLSLSLSLSLYPSFSSSLRSLPCHFLLSRLLSIHHVVVSTPSTHL